MLVVVVIIAVMVTGAVLALGVMGRDRTLETEARRLHALLALAREQAEIQTREYGLKVEPHGYRFLRFEPRSGEWIEAPDESLRARELPEGIALTLVVEGRPVVLNAQTSPTRLAPQVAIASSGTYSSFEIELVREASERVRIQSAEDGGLAELAPAT